jgi:hypothetical protein
MDILALGTLLLAAAALITLVITTWQVRVMSRQTLLSAVGESTFREARMPEWWKARDWIFEHLTVRPLPEELTPDHGVSNLPPPAREAIRKIGFLYDNLGLGRRMLPALAHLTFHDRQNVVYAAVVVMPSSRKRSCMPMRRVS